MARNKELNQQMKDARIEQILSSALKLFSTKGLAATKITDISEAADMSQGLIYHYYKSKEEIFIELIRGAFEKINAGSLYIENLPLSPREKIKTAIEGILENLEVSENSARYHLLVVHASISTAIPREAKSIIESENKKPYDTIARIIKAGQADGTIKNFDADELATIFWTSVKGLAMHKAVQGAKFKSPDPEILM
ncbi:TetR/AcrR family transcriptional regulator, partial [Bacteroidota bacterium]